MDSLIGFKRRTYAVILLVGWIGAAYAWITNEVAGAATSFTRAIFLLVILAMTGALWLLRRKGSIRVVEEGTYLVIGTVMIGVLVSALYGDLDDTLVSMRLFSLFLWVPFLFIFVFLAYERYGALVRSILLYLACVIVSAPALFVGDSALEGFNTLGLSYISMASIIAVLYFLTRMKDDLRRTELDAAQMKHLAETDSLTGILNRRGMENVMAREMERASLGQFPLTMIVFDLDDFKSLNDTHGHDVGDEALLAVARLVEAHLRATDSFARWGGEEFAVLCPETPAGSALRLADRIRVGIGDLELTDLDWSLSASFGVSELRRHDSGTSFAKRADIAMYNAKQNGKNRTEVAG